VPAKHIENFRSAKATTDVMEGLMNISFDRARKRAEIVSVRFVDVGQVDVNGSIKRRVEDDKKGDGKEAAFK